ncbi:hypothetical protein QTP86_024068 [Hemibagrus guttatus]|nr:hypothetical protein QTP86_024068 [Hemibagrus guttatus]
MIDIHPGQSAHMMVERTSSLRRSFRKDSNGTLEVAARPRASVTSPVYADLHGGGPFQGLVPSADPQSKRMKAMEQQLASLTGLVQNALFKGTNSSGGKEAVSEKLVSESLTQNTDTGGVSPVAVCKSPTLLSEPPVSPSAGGPALGLLLSGFHRNVSSLRQQLHQIRQAQATTSPWLPAEPGGDEDDAEAGGGGTDRANVREATDAGRAAEEAEDGGGRGETQIRGHGGERAAPAGEVVWSQCGVVCVTQKELVIVDLEKHVEQLKRNSSSAQRPVTLRDVEDGAVNLRKVGETLATLKGEFPSLQSRMHAVLRMEVEAVRFLKEEPQKMDNMLKRVKALTETLSSLRIRATEGSLHTDPISTKPKSPDSPGLTRDSATPQQRLSSNPAHFTITSSSNLAHCELVSSSSPIMAQRSCSSALVQSHGRDDPSVVTVATSDVQNEPLICRETAERDKVADRRQAEEEADMERILQKAQANLMNNIPDLELTNQEKSRASDTTSIRPDEVDTPQSTRPEATSPAEPVADKPVQSSLEFVHKPPIEKPHRASLDRATPNQDAANKSPPPAPPRRLPITATGLTTGRSGEVIFTTRQDPAPPQEREEEAVQSKPQRVRPELKPKPRTLPPINAREEEDDEHDEDKIIAELQVFEKCSVKDLEPRYVVDLTTHVLPDQALEPTFSLSSYGPKIIYYITGTAKTGSDNPLGGAEVQSDPREGVVSSPKVVHLNSPDFTQQPNVLTPSDLNLDSPKPVEESLKVSADTPKDISSDGDETNIPKESPENIASKPENQLLVSSENLIHASEKPSNNGSEVPLAKSLVRPETLVLSEDTGCQEDTQQVVMRSSRGRNGYTEEISLSPDLSADEPQPPSDNIAFMITKTRVQALSTGEYQQLVSSTEQDVQTVTVGMDETMSTSEDSEFSKKPVIIVFDEPMDIRQAYKRLSTIFECEEELDRTLSKERIIEDTEEISEEEVAKDRANDQVKSGSKSESTSGNYLQVPGQQQKPSDCSSVVSEDVSQVDLPSDTKQEAKKKFKFKFPKKQLAAIGQALRTGTKTGKKTLQVVVYEDEEDPDGTLKEAREAKRFEIKSSVDTTGPDISASETSESQTVNQQPSAGRTNEICQTAYKTLDSLEETIKQLETTITNMDPALSPDASCKDPIIKMATENQAAQAESSPSKKPAPLGPKPQKPPPRKKSKVQCVPRPSSSSSAKQVSPFSSSRLHLGALEHQWFIIYNSSCLAQITATSRKCGKTAKTTKAPGLPEPVQTGSFIVDSHLYAGRPLPWDKDANSCGVPQTVMILKVFVEDAQRLIGSIEK